MRPELMEWCENRPVVIRHNRVGSFGFMLATRTIQNYYIDWGDGVVEQKQFNNWTLFSHTYADNSVKSIIIRNLNPSEILKFYITTSSIVVSGLDISCAINIEVLKFFYCQNAFGSRLPSGFLDNYKNLTKFEYGFFGFSNLESIPTDLFKYNTKVTTFYQAFYMSKLTSVPIDLFKYNTAVTNFGYALGGNNNLVGEINLPEARLCNNMSNFAGGTKITKINFPENFAADVDANGVDMTNWVSECYQYNSPVSINFKLKVFKIWSSGSATIPIPSIRLLNQNSTFTGSTPQVDISGVALSTEATNQLLTDLPTLADKTIKLRTGTVCDATIATAKGWSVIFG